LEILKFQENERTCAENAKKVIAGGAEYENRRFAPKSQDKPAMSRWVEIRNRL